MNVTFTPSEIMHLFQTILKVPMTDPREQEHLVFKLKSSIIKVLSTEEDRHKEVAFKDWTLRESKKIEDLKQKNSDIGPIVKSTRRK